MRHIVRPGHAPVVSARGTLSPTALGVAEPLACCAQRRRKSRRSPDDRQGRAGEPRALRNTRGATMTSGGPIGFSAAAAAVPLAALTLAACGGSGQAATA